MKKNNFIILGFILLIIMKITISANEKYTNSLITQDSPYLKQHSNNPVNWFAWSNEAFKKAQDENKLIFLSIGYSTCHWCHVMEEESFENKEVAKILNKDFISIKVDREEMPHIDKYYQDLHYLVNKRTGGWPLTIILTPKRKAFFAASYIPIEKKYGNTGIKELLNNIQNDFTKEPEKIYELSNNIEQSLKHNTNLENKKEEIKEQAIKHFIEEIDNSYDHKNYGIGTRPKFPLNSIIETLLDIYSVSKNEKALSLALNQLKAMANGGIYDQIEGGFYRYSVDEKWMIPHFEKMLYTNAELLSSYSKAYMITNDVFYKNIVDEIINFTKQRFEENNLLYSASDADSLNGKEKEEGAYFVFVYDEVINHLENKNYTSKEIEIILNYFNITFEGNFENGLNNPYLSNKIKPNNLEKIKADLQELRSLKPYPFVDYKILTSWNAMYISSLFEAGKIHTKNSFDAIRLLDTLIEKLYINEVLYHQKIINKEIKVKALFEDYAFLIDALLKAYNFSLDEKYLLLAKKLNLEAINKFYKKNTWIMSDDGFKSLADTNDSSYRSPLSQMIENILKLAVLTDDLVLQNKAIKIIESNSFRLNKNSNNSAYLIRSYMAYKKEFIVLKAPKNMLKNKKLNNYPFLLKKSNIDEKYLACKIGICFAYDDEFENIVNKIKEEVGK